MLYRHLGKINPASETVHIFLHYLVRYSTDRSRNSLMSESQTMSRLSQTSDTKLFILLQLFCNVLSMKRLGLTVLAVKNLKDGVDHQFSPGAAGVHNRERIPRNTQ